MSIPEFISKIKPAPKFIIIGILLGTGIALFLMGQLSALSKRESVRPLEVYYPSLEYLGVPCKNEVY